MLLPPHVLVLSRLRSEQIFAALRGRPCGYVFTIEEDTQPHILHLRSGLYTFAEVAQGFWAEMISTSRSGERSGRLPRNPQTALKTGSFAGALKRAGRSGQKNTEGIRPPLVRFRRHVMTREDAEQTRYYLNRCGVPVLRDCHCGDCRNIIGVSGNALGSSMGTQSPGLCRIQSFRSVSRHSNASSSYSIVDGRHRPASTEALGLVARNRDVCSKCDGRWNQHLRHRATAEEWFWCFDCRGFPYCSTSSKGHFVL